MLTKEWKDTGLSLSRLGFGCMRLPSEGPRGQGIRRDEAEKLLDKAISAGVNYIDTAYLYHGGESEVFAGSVLKKYPRDSFCIATKLPGWQVRSPEDAERIFNDQLQRLQVDHFDFYLLHAVGRKGLKRYEELGIYEFLERKRKAGLVRNLGFSFHDTPEIFGAVLPKLHWDFCQLQLNYLDWEIQQAGTLYHMAAERNLPVMVMEPVRGGALASLRPEAEALLRALRPEWSNASWAFRFVASLPNVQVILSGMSDDAQLTDNLATFSDLAPLNEAELAALKEVRRLILAQDTIICTKCGYCTSCPSRIPISEVFSAFNEFAATGNRDALRKQYAAVTARAQACAGCGQCADACPQHINIPEELARIRLLLDD